MSDKDTDTSRLNDLLDDEDKQIGSAKGVLSRIFRTILLEKGITPMLWNQQMHAYLRDPRNRVEQTKRARSSTRGNLNRELLKPEMTWANFIKGIYFLNPIKAEFKITLHWRWGNPSVHTVVIGEKPEPPKRRRRNK